MLDAAAWPIICICPTVLSETVINSLEASLGAVLNRALCQRERVVLWIDPTQCENIELSHVVRVARMMNGFRPLVEKTIRCSFLIVKDRMYRRMFDVLFSLAKPVRSLRMYDHPISVVFETLGRLTLTLTEGSSLERRASKQSAPVQLQNPQIKWCF